MSQIKERPILMNGEMVRATLAGIKTNTRRLVKPQPDVAIAGHIPGDGVCGRFTPDDERLGRIAEAIKSPFGMPGDRLYVRETWAPHADHPTVCAVYRADPECKYDAERWFPSIHMPRKFSRIDLDILTVRVERLQDISEADAKAEGAQPALWTPEAETASEIIDWPLKELDNPYRNGFALMWQSIYGAGSWAANPWVWAYEFKRVQA